MLITILSTNQFKINYKPVYIKTIFFINTFLLIINYKYLFHKLQCHIDFSFQNKHILLKFLSTPGNSHDLVFCIKNIEMTTIFVHL